jgi:hypothetical protein
MKILIKKGSVLIMACLMVLASCKNEESPKLISVSDPNAVSQALEVNGGTYVLGSLPSPSVSEEAPILEDDFGGEQLLAIQGSKIIINASVVGGNAVTGFYVQVDGADGYFNVTSTSVTARLGSDRKNIFGKSLRVQNEYPAFSITMPDNIGAGEFCITFSAYAGGLVSNVIQQCITVSELGGANSGFLSANEWSLLKSEELWEGELYLNVIGVADVDSYETEIPCEGGYIAVQVEDTYKDIYLYAKFAPGGVFSYEDQDYEKYFDYENSTNCAAVYIENTIDDSAVGAWSYDHETGMVLFVYNDEWDGEVETVIEQYEAEIVNGKLILLEQYNETDYHKLTFALKSN